MNDFVSITIVTYNSGRFIKRCLESVLEQDYKQFEIVVVDNASTDGTIDILEPFSNRCRIHYNQQNVGFAAGQNHAIELTTGEWVLTLNPDVLLEKDFIQRLIDASHMDPKAGTICGRLFSIPATFELPEKQLLDSTGIFFTLLSGILIAAAKNTPTDDIRLMSTSSEPQPQLPCIAVA